jgi:uncharacterized protein YjiS (DUF1127 family)
MGVSIRDAPLRRLGETRLIAVLINPMETKMALSTLFDDVDYSEAAKASNAVHTALAAVANAVAGWRAERARRLALNDLLAMEPHRLNDLGISIDDVRAALIR